MGFWPSRSPAQRSGRERRTLQRVVLFSVGVCPVWETDGIVETSQKQETPPSPMTGFLKAYAVRSCKVDSNGETSAECKENLLDHPDEIQP